MVGNSRRHRHRVCHALKDWILAVIQRSLRRDLNSIRESCLIAVPEQARDSHRFQGLVSIIDARLRHASVSVSFIAVPSR